MILCNFQGQVIKVDTASTGSLWGYLPLEPSYHIVGDLSSHMERPHVGVPATAPWWSQPTASINQQIHE